VLGELSFDWLFGPVENLDGWLTDLFHGAPLVVALGIAFLLGLRHASDPDHLVAVTSLVTTEGERGTRGATRLGAWWGLGHATVLVLVGLPLIALESQLPSWLESAAEKVVGVVIVALALRIAWRWLRGDLSRAGREHEHRPVRGPRQAFAIGILHGLAGTGAVVVLLITALPDPMEAAAALAVFAPMSVISMAACTTAYSWVFTRPAIDPIFRSVLVPALGAFGLIFGLWYAGIT
jgi:High-affinity nickel-transport protein